MEDWSEKPSSNISNDRLLIDDSQYEYVKELKMRRELSVEGDFGTQCDSKYYYNDPVTDNIEEHERIQSVRRA